MAAETTLGCFIFPLNTVLFPGGRLPLRVFEQRYIEMTKQCIARNQPFGVCQIKEGRETGTPAVPESIGCLSRIVEWDMPQLGVFQLQTEGIQRFRILHSSVARNGLISATIETLPNEDPVAPSSALCTEVLKAIIEKVGAEHFPSPQRFDDAAWIGYRLSEILPIDRDTRQRMLQLSDPTERLAELEQVLNAQGAPRPLAKERWAGGIDSVGSATLANVLSMTKYGGAVAACGLAAGMDLPGSVAPFILRGVSLLGIDSVQCSPKLRTEAWRRLESDLDRGKLEAMTTQIGLPEVIEMAGAILDGRVRGRIVVKIG